MEVGKAVARDSWFVVVLNYDTWMRENKSDARKQKATELNPVH
jgi:hypothetical protein